MNDSIAIALYALMFLGGLAIGAFLVIRGHPWFALLVLLIVSSLSLRTR